MFKLRIYKHQMFGIIFNSFICLILRLSSFILSFSLKENNDGKKEGNEKIEKSLFEISSWYIALGLFTNQY